MDFGQIDKKKKREGNEKMIAIIFIQQMCNKNVNGSIFSHTAKIAITLM